MNASLTLPSLIKAVGIGEIAQKDGDDDETPEGEVDVVEGDVQPFYGGKPVGDNVEEGGGGGEDESEYTDALQENGHELVRLESRGAVEHPAEKEQVE